MICQERFTNTIKIVPPIIVGFGSLTLSDELDKARHKIGQQVDLIYRGEVIYQATCSRVMSDGSFFMQWGVLASSRCNATDYDGVK